MVEIEPNRTIEERPTAVEPYKIEQFDSYISYLALGGLTTTDDGIIKKIPVDKFCEASGVAKSTLYEWKKRTPNIAELVKQRREDLMPIARESALWNQLYLLGMQTQDKRAAVDAIKTLLGHFAALRLPSQEVKHGLDDSWFDIIKQYDVDEIIEGETVDAPTSNQ